MVSQYQDLEMQAHFVVNFGPELKEIFSESRYFEQLGFSVPEQVAQVALLQEKLLR